MSEVEVYQRALNREKQARLDAEEQLENSSRELYKKNQALQQQQSAMLKNEKLATIGMLSAGVAHEINNPLAVVISNLNALTEYNQQLLGLLGEVQQWQKQGQLPDAISSALESMDAEVDFDFISEDAPDMMADMKEGLLRMQEIVSNLKTFSRTKPGERQFIDINACIEASLKLVNNEIKDHCTVSLDLQSSLPKTAANNSELSQVFMNLVINAAHAMEQGGIIRVHTSLQDNQIKIQIADNGSGIPENIRKDIFNPFFTTKPPGHGTGMGLSVVHGIIQDHNGSIGLNSKMGVGTCFTIRLPVVSAQAEDEEQETASEMLTG